MPDDTGVFDMDTEHESSIVSRDRHGDTQSQATSSTCGELSSVDCSLDRRGSIDLCRRAVPVIEAEEDICSICLDEFSQEDPGNPTVCGHQYHLQCIMQWAQRSRECPMCFRALQLQDPTMQELLPFGEYIPPEHSQPAQHMYMGLEAWELERILARLAVTNGAPVLSTGRRRGHSRAEAVIVPENGKAVMDRTSTSGQENGAPSEQAPSNYGESSYPSSWPPHSAHGKPQPSSSHPQPAGPQDIHRSSVSSEYPLKNAAESFKSRWSAVSSKCKESISKLSRQTNARWAPKGHHETSDAESSSSTAA